MTSTRPPIHPLQHVVTARLLEIDTTPIGNMERAYRYNRRRRELAYGSPNGPLSWLKCFNRYGYTSFLNVKGPVYSWTVAADVPVDVSQQQAVIAARLKEIRKQPYDNRQRILTVVTRIAQINPNFRAASRPIDGKPYDQYPKLVGDWFIFRYVANEQAAATQEPQG